MKITIRHKDTSIVIEEATLRTANRSNTLLRYNDEKQYILDAIKETTKCVIEMSNSKKKQ